MTQLGFEIAQVKPYSNRQDATTTTDRFERCNNFEATVWQDDSARPHGSLGRRPFARRRCVSPAVSVDFDALFRQVVALRVASHSFESAAVSNCPLHLVVSGASESDEESDEKPWLGVIELPHERKVLFTQTVEVKKTDVPSWKPHFTFNPRWIESDDD